MNETIVQERTDTILDVQEAPAANLPAITQERRPRKPPQPKPASYPAAIAAAILKVTREIGRVIKDGEHDFHHYRYPKWETINEQLAPLLSDHGLIIVQSEQNRSLLEENDKGSVLAIIYHFTLISETGEQWPAVEWTAVQRLRDQKGITDDKAATKCHTQARKSFCLKLFNIRVEEQETADQRHTLPKKDARELYKKLQAEIDGAESAVEIGVWGKNPENVSRKKMLPPDWQDIISTRFREKLAELQGGPKVVWDDERDPFDPETGEV